MKKNMLSFTLLGLMLLSNTLVSCGNKLIDFNEPSMDDNYRSYYEIFVGSFADSNGDGTGDLKGIENKISYIKDLGFRGIWLTPIFSSPSYHKYNTSDYFNIDSSFGTLEDLKSLVKTCHENNIKIILDLAINHSSRRNSMYAKAVAAYAYKKDEATNYEKSLLEGLSSTEIDEYASLYSFSDNGESTSVTYRRVSYPQLHNFFVEANFDEDMPEFNFDSEMAQNYFKSIIDYYMSDEIGVDGFRLDAVKYYYMNNDTKNCEALNKINSYIKSNNKNGYVVAENWSSQNIIDDYYKITDLDSYFYFPGQGSTGFIAKVLNYVGQASSFLNGQTSMIQGSGENIPAPFIDNHDTTRITKSDLTDAKFLYGCFSTLTGNTFTYYGDEVGIKQNSSANDSDPSKRTHMPWGDSKIECNDPESGIEAESIFGTVSKQLKDGNSLVNFVKQANNIRLAYPTIVKGTITNSNISSENSILTIDKSIDNDSIRIVYNFDHNGRKTYSISDSYNTILAELDGSKEKVKKSGNEISIPPMSILFLGNESEA